MACKTERDREIERETEKERDRMGANERGLRKED